MTYVVCQNRRAYYDYSIEEKIEAGIVLLGSEVKSLRAGHLSLSDSFAGEGESGFLYLFNAHISEYKPANKLNHQPKRARKLLISKKQQNRLFGKISKGGYTLIPTRVYFNDKGLAKVELGLAKNKKKIDKRETIKEREWQRNKSRILRNDVKS